MSRIDDILKAAEKARLNKPSLDTTEAIEITTALYELCKQNGRPSSDRDKYFYLIESCLDELTKNNAIQARAFYSRVPVGGNGCFNDWWPENTLKLPSNSYDGMDFEEIVIAWSKIMRTLHC